MHTAVIGCIGAVVAVMTSLFIEPWFPLGDWRWAVGVVAGLVLMVGVWVHKERRVLVTGGSRRRLHADDAPAAREQDERETPEDTTGAAEPVDGADVVRVIGFLLAVGFIVYMVAFHEWPKEPTVTWTHPTLSEDEARIREAKCRMRTMDRFGASLPRPGHEEYLAACLTAEEFVPD